MTRSFQTTKTDPHFLYGAPLVTTFKIEKKTQSSDIHGPPKPVNTFCRLGMLIVHMVYYSGHRVMNSKMPHGLIEKRQRRLRSGSVASQELD